MKTDSVNRTKLYAGLLTSLLVSISVPSLVLGFLLTMSSIQYGFDWAFEFMLDMITTDLITQICLSGLFLCAFIPLCALSIKQSVESVIVVKPVRVKIGNRYLHLKSAWSARKEMSL